VSTPRRHLGVVNITASQVEQRALLSEMTMLILLRKLGRDGAKVLNKRKGLNSLSSLVHPREQILDRSGQPPLWTTSRCVTACQRLNSTFHLLAQGGLKFGYLA